MAAWLGPADCRADRRRQALAQRLVEREAFRQLKRRPRIDDLDPVDTQAAELRPQLLERCVHAPNQERANTLPGELLLVVGERAGDLPCQQAVGLGRTLVAQGVALAAVEDQARSADDDTAALAMESV